MITWTLQTRNIADLKPHPKNPRRLTKDQEAQLAKSLDKFGLIDKPVVTQDNLIIGGHQRVRVLKKQGVKDVECWVASEPMSEKDVEECMLRLNKNLGDFDDDMLANLFDIGDLVEYGFDDKDLGLCIDVETEEPTAKKKKLNTCPSCGYEY